MFVALSVVKGVCPSTDSRKKCYSTYWEKNAHYVLVNFLFYRVNFLPE